jgi:hypothetical protein
LTVREQNEFVHSGCDDNTLHTFEASFWRATIRKSGHDTARSQCVADPAPFGSRICIASTRQARCVVFGSRRARRGTRLSHGAGGAPRGRSENLLFKPRPRLAGSLLARLRHPSCSCHRRRSLPIAQMGTASRMRLIVHLLGEPLTGNLTVGSPRTIRANRAVRSRQ